MDDQAHRYKITRETWNKVALIYQEKFMDLDLYDETYNSFCKCIVKKNPRILELGCGPGNITRYLLSRRPDFVILAIDYAPSMIDLAARHNPSARFQRMDIREIDRLQPEFDGIVCGFCVPYLSETNLKDMIKNVYRLLSGKGFLYLSFVEGDYNDSHYQVGRNGDKMYVYYYETDKIRKVLSTAGFRIIHNFRIPYGKPGPAQLEHIIIIAAK